MSDRSFAIVLSSLILLLASCDRGAPSSPKAVSTGLHGHLLLIGGGLQDDNKHVYERFVALARAAAKSESPRILIATAASLNEEPAGRIEIIKPYCPTCEFDAIMRTTPAEETIAKTDAASAMFFTGGDQKRITQRYLTGEKGDRDTSETAAMRRLLARGGVIAGTSAGDAMMSDPMFLSGGSAEALGMPTTRPARNDDDDENSATTQSDRERHVGPRIGKGMGFLPWAIADSHFFERHRFGRLVAALETSGKRLGIGVSENACVEINLETGEAIGISAAESLLVDIGGVTRDGLARRNIRTFVIKQGRTISLIERMDVKVANPPARPTTVEHLLTTATRRDRRTAARRFFTHSAETDSAQIVRRLNLDGYDQFAWPVGLGWSVVDIEPHVETGVSTQPVAPITNR